MPKVTPKTTKPAATEIPFDAERGYEVGMDEFFKGAQANLYNNMKLTYDATLTQFMSLNNIALQALQNAVQVAHRVANNGVETDNMIAKQAVAHRDVAVDATWDPGPGEESLKPTA